MTICFSVGRYGGFYFHRPDASLRLCLGWLAITVLRMEIDDLLRNL